MTLKDTGEAFIALGRALLDETSTLDELTALAMKAGVQLQFRIAPAVCARCKSPSHHVSDCDNG